MELRTISGIRTMRVAFLSPLRGSKRDWTVQLEEQKAAAAVPAQGCSGEPFFPDPTQRCIPSAPSKSSNQRHKMSLQKEKGSFPGEKARAAPTHHIAPRPLPSPAQGDLRSAPQSPPVVVTLAPARSPPAVGLALNPANHPLAEGGLGD